MEINKDDMKKAVETAKVLKRLEKKPEEEFNKMRKSEDNLEDLKKGSNNG